jgi:hypothetical protein
MIKLQRGIVTHEGEEQVVICNVSNPDKPEVLLSLFNSWNNQFVADHIIDCLINYEKDKSK